MRRSHSLSSPSALASFEESLQVATSPCCWRDLPDVISANPSRSAWAPVTAVPWSAPACFFPHVIGLPPYTIEVGLTRVNPSKRFHDGSHFRDCSHFVIFRPSGLLASQIVPTAATYSRRAAEALRPSRTCVVASACIGYANHPPRQLVMWGLTPH